MNKIYRVVWNTELGQWVVASEVAKGRKKKAARPSVLASAVMGATSLVMAGGAMAVTYDNHSGSMQVCNGPTGYAYGSGNAGAANVNCIYGNTTFSLNSAGDSYGGEGYLASNVRVTGHTNDTLELKALGGIDVYANALRMNGSRISGLAPGAAGTDAVNVDQLNAKFAQAGTDANAVHYDGPDKTKATLAGTGGTTLANVKAGTQNGDAVNLGQLKAAGLTVDGSGTPTNAFVAYDATAKDKITLGGGTNGTTIDNVKAGNLALGSKEAVNGGQLFDTNQKVTNLQNNYTTLNTTVEGLRDSALLWDGSSAYTAKHAGTNAKIKNLAAGDVNATSTDAINGSQLFGTADSVAKALGGGSTAGTDGKVSMPSYKVNDVATTGGVQGAIEALDKRITDIPAGGDSLKWDANAAGGAAYSANHGSPAAASRITNVADATQASDAVNKGQMEAAIEPFKEIAPKLKYIKFGVTSAPEAQAGGSNAVAIGGNAFAQGNNALAIGTNATASALNSVAVGFGSQSSEADTFAVGSKTSKRRIVNVIDGSAKSDAATVGQVERLIDAKFAPAVQNASLLKSTSLKGGLLGATSSLPPEQLIASGKTDKIDQIQAEGTDALAIGLNTHAVGEHAVAVGGTVSVTGPAGVGVGDTISVSGASAVAIGTHVSALADNAIAIGNAGTNVQGAGSIAIGRNTEVGIVGTDALAIGNNIASWGADSITLGNNSTDDGVANVVSVGSADIKRKIVNVAAGAVTSKSTDAVNGSQLFGTADAVAKALGGGSTVGADGKISLPKYKVDNVDRTGVDAAISALDAHGTALRNDALLWDAAAAGGAGAFNAKHGSQATSKVVNVAKGTDDNDAVNVKQLNDTIAGLPNNPNAVSYDGPAKDKLTLAGVDGTTIAGVKAGVGDDEAVNVKQLKDAGLIDGGGEVQKAVLFNGPNGEANAAGKKIVGVVAGTDNTDAVNVKQLKDAGLIDDTGKSLNAVVYDSATKDKVTFNKGGVTVKLSNVAKGTDDNDAVNVKQLNDTIAGLPNNPNAVSYDGPAKDRLTLAGVDGTTIAGVKAGVGDDEAVNVKQLKDAGLIDNTGKSLNAVVYDGAAKDTVTFNKGGAAVKLANVADGKAASDAVNLGQLDGAVKVITDSVKEIAPKLKYIKFGATTAPDAQASGTNAVAIGGNAFAQAPNAMAIGANANVTGLNSVAIGFGSQATETDTFAVGSKTSKRRIVNVEEGKALTDAATVGQVTKMIDAKLPVTISGKSALQSTSSRAGMLGAAASLSPEQLIASGETDKAGQIQAEGADALAIGLNTHAVGEHTVAVGGAVSVTGPGAVGVGETLAVSGQEAVAVGSHIGSLADYAVAIGTGGTNAQGLRSVVIGYGSEVGTSGTDSVAIGNNIASWGSNSVTLGNNSSDDGIANIVSVGSKDIQRKIVYVAAGTNNTDAVNVSQLKSVAAAIGGGSTVGTDGMVTLPTYTLNGKDKTGTVAEAISDLDERIGKGSNDIVDALLWDADAEGFSAAHGDSATSLITNVADGALKEGSSDAVTGGQLFGTVSDVASALGTTVDENGKLVEPTYTVGGTEAKGVDGAVTALDGRIDGVNGKVTEITNNYNTLAGDVLKWDAGATAFSAKHGSQAESRITNVADATQATDAINKRSLDKAIAEVSTKADPMSVKYDGTDKTKVTLGGADAKAPVTLSNVADGVADNDAINVKQFKAAGLISPEGKTLDAVVYDANSAKASVTFGGANGTTLNNVADGLITRDSRQAVNGGQIFQLKEQLNQSITNIDNRVTKIEQNGTGGGKADYISANPVPADVEAPKAANAGTTAGIAVGYNASASGEQASAMGDHAVAQAKDSVAVGNGSTVTEAATNSVALGNNSVADTANTVSVGAAGNERTLSHVARGTAESDAATMGQMRETLGEANAYTDARMNDVWQDLGNEINHVNRQANRGIAAASSLINVTPYVPGHTTVNAGMASYRGETALGVGVSRWSENGRVNFNAGVSAAKDDEPVFRVGIGYIF